MTTTAQAAASPVAIKLAGNEYRMSPLCDADFGEYERWMQSRVIRMARDSIADNTPEDTRQFIMDSAMRVASAVTLASPEGMRFSMTREGASLLVYLGLRHNHPDLTRAGVADMLMDDRTMVDAMDQFDLVNDKQAASDKKKVAKRKTRKRRSR